MKKTAIIFPGQGSQYVGMGQLFADIDTEAAALLDLAEKISGFPIRKLCFEGPMQDLTRVLYLQPALTAINLICWQQFQKMVPECTPSFLGGHSLGEYTALHAAGVLSLEDTLALVTRRGELMEREGVANPGGMRAVLGMSIDEINVVLAEFNGPGTVVVANHNTPAQIVVSGDSGALKSFGKLCKEKGAKVIPLKVSVANHSPLVAGAVDDFADFMASIPFNKAQIPVIFNVTGDILDDPEQMKAIMARQIASTVRWLDVVEKMVAGGVEVIVELGPKNVLTGMMKKILPKTAGVQCFQADTPESLQEVAAAIRES